MGKRLTELDLRRRNCKVCTRWKHAIDFPWRWKANGILLPVPYVLTTCLVCKAEKEKERYDSLSPEEKREKGKKANAQAAARRRQLEHQVEKLETRLGKYKKRYGTPKGKYRDEILLDLLPLRMFLLRQARVLGSIKAIAEAVGVDEAQVRRHVNGYYWESDCHAIPIRQVTLGLVDDYLVRLNADERIDELYPEVDELIDALTRNT